MLCGGAVLCGSTVLCGAVWHPREQQRSVLCEERVPVCGSVPRGAGAVRGAQGAGGSREEPGQSVAHKGHLQDFPLARSLPASVNKAVGSGKHVFLGRLLFLEEVSWRQLGRDGSGAAGEQSGAGGAAGGAG